MNTSESYFFVKIKININRKSTKVFYPNENNNQEVNFIDSNLDDHYKFKFTEMLCHLYIKFDLISDELLIKMIHLSNKSNKIKKRTYRYITKKEIVNKLNQISKNNTNNEVYYNFKYKNNDKSLNPYIRNMKKEKNLILKKEYLVKLEEFINNNNNNFKSLKTIKNAFENSHEYKSKNISKVKISNSTFYLWVTSKKNLNYSIKKASKYHIPELNNHKIKLIRYEYAREILLHRLYGNEIIYIDESSFKYTDFILKGWSKRGRKLEANNKIKNSLNISLLAGISESRVVSFIFFEGGVTSSCFYSWLLQTYQALNLNLEKTVFVMDNLKSHKSKKYFLKLKSYFQILFLPIYTPMMNPIEYMFSYLKNYTRRIVFNNQNQYLNYVRNIINGIDKDKLVEFIRGADRYILKSINFDNF